MIGTELFFVRNGEHDFTGASTALEITEKRLGPSIRKRQDQGLTEKGREQAKDTAKKLGTIISERGKVVLFSSPLRRARESAGPISDFFSVPVTLLHGFEELRLGEGSPAEIWQKARADIAAKPTPDSESFCEMSDRVMQALEGALSGNGGKKIIFVTHIGVMESIFYSLLQIPIEKNIVCGPIMGHGSILHFVYDEFQGKAGFRLKIKI